METLGLSEKAISAGVYATSDTFTLTVNVLIEHRRTLIAISRYLYYSLSRRRGFHHCLRMANRTLCMIWFTVCRRERDDPDMQNIVDPHLEIEFLNQDSGKICKFGLLISILKNCWIKNKLDRLPPYGKVNHEQDDNQEC